MSSGVVQSEKCGLLFILDKKGDVIFRNVGDYSAIDTV